MLRLIKQILNILIANKIVKSKRTANSNKYKYLYDSNKYVNNYNIQNK